MKKIKTMDSVISPFITQKDVILCRSGIQVYHKSEVEAFITEDNKPPKEKEVYLEYRPANVVVKAQDLFKSLPVCCEHPSEWITPDNWSELVGGVLDKEVSVVALDGEAEGEIGLKSNVTFYTRELYDYYLDNKEVSVGYTCTKHFVDNPDEVGYDIILDEITEVNHLAITRAGRGGSSVAVIDSMLGGLRPMRTGIFAFLASKKKVVNDSTTYSFGKEVLNAVKNSKDNKEEFTSEMKNVLDSMSILKDGEAKDKLVNIVKDCFDNKELSIKNEQELVSTLDNMWVDIHGDSLEEITNAFSRLDGKSKEGATKDSDSDKKEDETKDSDKKEDETKDSDSDKKEDETKDSDSDKKDDEETKDSDKKEDETKDSDKKEDGCNKDSSIVLTKDDIKKVMDSELKPLIVDTIKEVLGIKSNTKPSVEGSELDSDFTGIQDNRDYSAFLD